MRAPFAALLGLVLLSAPTAARDGAYLFDVVKKEPQRTAWNALIKPLRKAHPWMVGANGVAAPAVPVTVDGTAFDVFFLCKPHDCGGNRMQVMFAGDGRKAYAIFRTPKGEQVLGSPDDLQRRALAAAFN